MALRSGAAAAPAANQASSSPDLTTIEARVAALENQAGSPQQAAPATHETRSAVDELTCTKHTVVNSAGQTMVELSERFISVKECKNELL